MEREWRQAEYEAVGMAGAKEKRVMDTNIPEDTHS